MRNIFDGSNTRAARPTLLQELWKRARRKLDMLNAAKELGYLRTPPANRLERLKGDLAGHYSIRINDQYRILFEWEEGKGACGVKIADYH